MSASMSRMKSSLITTWVAAAAEPAAQQRADARSCQRGGQDQASEEARTSAGQDVRNAWERLSVDRERPVGMPYDHRNVLEVQGPPDLAGAPPQSRDHLQSLIGPFHVVVSDGP